MKSVTFQVRGVPQPKGSARAFVPLSWTKAAAAANRPARAVVTSANPQGKGWTQLVRECAQTATAELFHGPVTVSIRFALPRPTSLPKKVSYHVKKPDLDKLARCALDGLSGVVFQDDRCVIDLHVTKVYADGSFPPGAEITVSSVQANLFT